MTLAAILAAHSSKSATPSPAGVAGCGAAGVGAQRATPATPATPQKATPGLATENRPDDASLAPLLGTLKQVRAVLLDLAAAKYVDVDHVHRLRDADLTACAGLDKDQLAAYLSMLEESAERHAGRVPAGHTAAIHCHHCGTVWATPEVAAVLPVVGSWPRALGCPWCFVRKAGGQIPRPPVTCEGCQHFVQDTINPAAGMGSCASDNSKFYPMQKHRCADHWPR
jgi:hypothetical protein